MDYQGYQALYKMKHWSLCLNDKNVSECKWCRLTDLFGVTHGSIDVVRLTLGVGIWKSRSKLSKEYDTNTYRLSWIGKGTRKDLPRDESKYKPIQANPS